MENARRAGKGRGLSRENALALAVCALTAAIILMICSTNSFLYPVSGWCDVDCFVTVARGWMRGMMPYRDLAEQKGPLLYALHIPALLLFPGSYHGIWFLELIEVTAALFLSWKLARLYAPKLSLGWIPPLAAALCASFAFQLGDSAEEMCWPLILGSMYGILRAWRTGRPISMKGFVGHGVLAGCVLWIKFNQLAPHFVFMAMLAILAVWEDRSVMRALKMCGMFLLGMLIASLPWLIYFGAKGALGDMLRMYLYDNAFGYTTEERVTMNAAVFFENIGMHIRRCRVMTAVLGVAILRVITLKRARMGLREKAYFLLALALTVLAVYGGGRKYFYYFFALAPFAALALPAAEWVEKPVRALLEKIPAAPARRVLAGALCAVLLAGSIGYAWLGCANVPRMKVPYEETPQGRIGAYIRASGEETLVTFGTLDYGFYYAADIMPVTRFFCGLNNYPVEAAVEQAERIMSGDIHFIVTRNRRLEEFVQMLKESGNAYQIDFDPDFRLALQADQFYLYERNEPDRAMEE